MRVFRLILFIVIFILFSYIVLGNILINEIMFDPEECSDSYCEWIEIFNNNSFAVNISGYKISDRTSDLTKEYNRTINFFNETNISAFGYFIIAKKKANFSQFWNVSCGIAESAFNLNNDQEIVALYSVNNSIVDSIYYNDSFEIENGESLQFFNGSLCVNKATAGDTNFCIPPPLFKLNFPSYVLNDGTIFLARADISGFNNGFYDFKAEMKDANGNNIGKIYDMNDKGWQSCTYYVYNAVNASNGNGNYIAYLKIDNGYAGIATIKGRLRVNGGSSYSDTDLYVFNAVSKEFSDVGSSVQEDKSSSIRITDVSPSEVDFGDVIDVKLNVYKGDTTKYAVYLYVENENDRVSEKITLHFKDKFTNYSLTVPVQLDLNCDGEYNTGEYTVYLEGLDKKDSHDIDVKGKKSSECGSSSSSSSGSSSKSSSSDDKKETETTSGRFYYELVGKPENIFLGDGFSSSVKVENTKGYSINTKVYSYVYRGSKCYSGERTENMQEFILASGESKTIELKNIVEEAEPGEYNFKVRIERSDIKSGNEITSSINLLERENKNINEEKTSEIIGENKTTEQQENEEYKFKRLPKVIYQSVSYKSKSLVPYLIVFISVLTALILIWKR